MSSLTYLYDNASSMYKYIIRGTLEDDEGPQLDPAVFHEADSGGGGGSTETDIGTATILGGSMRIHELENSNFESHESSSPEGQQSLLPEPVKPGIEPEPNEHPMTHSNRSQVPVSQHPSAIQRQAQVAPPSSIRKLKRGKQLEEINHQLKSENDELNYRYDNLNKIYRRLLQDCHAIKDDLTRSEIHLDSVSRKADTLQNDNDRLRDKCSALEKDNNLLRNQIASMSSAQEPLREEKYYIDGFNQIKGEIDSWVAKETKSKPTEPLSDETRDAISSAIASLGINGRHSSENLMSQLPMFYGDRRKRIALIRHIVAIFLFEKIFGRFAFGLNRVSSEYLNYIETEIYSSDLDLSKILMVRQSLGKATLSAGKDSVELRRTTRISQVIDLLRLLLPATSQEKLETFVTKIIHKSIVLRDAMTEEQAVYRCFVLDRGHPFDESTAQVADGEELTGNVLMCTFPGLRRLIIRNHTKEFVSVVKATVKLEGVFGPEVTNEVDMSGVQTEPFESRMVVDATETVEIVQPESE